MLYIIYVGYKGEGKVSSFLKRRYHECLTQRRVQDFSSGAYFIYRNVAEKFSSAENCTLNFFFINNKIFSYDMFFSGIKTPYPLLSPTPMQILHNNINTQYLRIKQIWQKKNPRNSDSSCSGQENWCCSQAFGCYWSSVKSAWCGKLQQD